MWPYMATDFYSVVFKYEDCPLVSKMDPKSYIYIYIYSSPVAAPLSIRGSNPRSRIYIYIYSSPVAAPVFSRPDRNCQMALSDCLDVPSRSGLGQSQLSQGARLPQMASPHHRRTTFWRWEGHGWNCWPSEDPQGFPRLFLMMLIWGASWTPKTARLDPPLRATTF